MRWQSHYRLRWYFSSCHFRFKFANLQSPSVNWLFPLANHVHPSNTTNQSTLHFDWAAHYSITSSSISVFLLHSKISPSTPVLVDFSLRSHLWTTAVFKPNPHVHPSNALFPTYSIGSTGGVLNSADHRAIRQGKNVNAVWIEPAPELVVGDIRERADQAGVNYVRLPAYWFTKKGSHFNPQHKPSKNEKVIYSLHGKLLTTTSFFRPKHFRRSIRSLFGPPLRNPIEYSTRHHRPLFRCGSNLLSWISPRQIGCQTSSIHEHVSYPTCRCYCRL